MEIFLGTIKKVPPLMSPQDIVIRKYMAKRDETRILENNLVGLSAMASGGFNQELVKIVEKKVKDIHASLTGLDVLQEKVEIDLKQQYEHIRNKRPVLSSKQGKLTVEGL